MKTIEKITVPIADGVPRRERRRAAALIRRDVREALEKSPHRIIGEVVDFTGGAAPSLTGVTFHVDTGDLANASTIIHEAVASLKVAQMPSRVIHV